MQALGSLGEPLIGNVAHLFNCFPPFSLATWSWGPLSKPGLFVCLVVFSGHLVVPKKVMKALVPRITSLFFCIFVCLVNCFPPEKVCKPWGKLGVSCICLFVYINCVPPFLFALFVCPWMSCVSCDFFSFTYSFVCLIAFLERKFVSPGVN